MAARGLRSSARLNGVGAAVAAASPPAAASRAAAAERVAAAERRARAAERAREVEDSPRVLRDKCRRLARALRNAKHLVVYTGAGISTAADIPDYRGPRGVWTRLRRGEAVGRVEVARARPTFTHMALTALWARGALKFVASQNCDGLHLRAGLPRRALAELHGDMFCERCAACRRVYLRAFDTTERTARHRHGTRRLCHACGAELHDTIVHFGERGRAAWPLNWAGALRHARRADVVLCLGSSLKVLRRYPRLWRMHRPRSARPRLYIVNLQWTPKDSVAALKINARCDDVMRAVARRLRLRVPRYRPARDPLLAHAEPLAAAEAHTTRRPPLPPPPAPALAFVSDHEELGSPSASDSDEELPLHRLADRLRRADRLRAFRVSMHSGEATILLRPEHAPAEPATSPPSPARRLTSELRRVRIPRRDPAPLLSLDRADAVDADAGVKRLQIHTRDRAAECELEPKLESKFDANSEAKFEPNFESAFSPKLDPAFSPKFDPAFSPKLDPTFSPKLDPTFSPKFDPAFSPKLDPTFSPKLDPTFSPKLDPTFSPKLDPTFSPKLDPAFSSGSEAPESDGASSGASGGAGSLAAAIIARAVLLCRGSLYPGLHTILAPAAPRAAPECAWCARHYRARRCLWYGPPREPAPAARAWRRVRARRYLCACCGAAGAAAAAAADADADADADVDTGGWYGKGYRKGRRR